MSRDGISAMSEIPAKRFDKIFGEKKIVPATVIKKQCELCSGSVEVVGDITKSYKNLDKITIEKLRTVIDTTPCEYKLACLEGAEELEYDLRGQISELKARNEKQLSLLEAVSICHSTGSSDDLKELMVAIEKEYFWD